jgi:nicotinamidase-related amidase
MKRESPDMSKYTAPLWSSSALITIDTQQDTLDGQPFEVPGTSAILPRMKAILEAYRQAGRPIVHIVRIYRSDSSNVDLCRKEMVEQGAALLLAGSPGCEPAPDLLPDAGIGLDADLLLSGGIQTLGPREAVIYKPRWGAFYHTPLEAHLRSAGISTLVFTGCNFPNCPRTSVYEAGERDFRIVVVDDAVSGMYAKAREEMRNIGVALLTADQVIEAIQAQKETT